MRTRRWGIVLALLLTVACGGASDDRDAGGAAAGGGTSARGGGADGAAVDDLLVAAASDLRPAFEVLAATFEDRHGVAVALDLGSSGQLAQRTVEGAPYDVFASADAGFVDRVLAAGRGVADTRTTYAAGRIVLWAPADRWAGWTSLADVAADGAVTTVAIANPEHAPYGRAARQALERSGALPALEEKLVLGENVADAHRLVESGNADAGITALSLALAADERAAGGWQLLDDDLHDPLRQDLLVVADDPARAEVARAFVDLVGSEDGREVMRRYGFLLPGEEAAP